jgi:hypothetical protein
MSLEEKTREFMVEGDFNRENFVKTGKIYQDIGKWAQILQKDSTNPDVMKKAGKAFYGDPHFYYQSGTSPRPRLEDTLPVLQDNRARYAKEKYSDITDGFNDGHWMGLISNLPLYKTGDKENNKLIGVLNEKRKIGEVSEDLNKIIQFLHEKSRKFDPVVQSEFAREIHNERYLKTLFGLYAKEVEIKYARAFYDEEGKLKKGLAKNLFEASLRLPKRKWKKKQTKEIKAISGKQI